MKILLIDDDLTIRFTLKKLLHKYFDRLEIYTSEDGVKGLGLAYIIKPDLIIVDSTLPRYSGRELVEYFVSNEKFSKTPIFLLSESSIPFDNLPSNYTQVSKGEEGFPESLILRLEPHIGERRSSRMKGFLNFLSSYCIEYNVF